MGIEYKENKEMRYFASCDRAGCVRVDIYSEWFTRNQVNKNLEKKGWFWIGNKILCPDCQGGE